MTASQPRLSQIDLVLLIDMGTDAPLASSPECKCTKVFDVYPRHVGPRYLVPVSRCGLGCVCEGMASCVFPAQRGQGQSWYDSTGSTARCGAAGSWLLLRGGLLAGTAHRKTPRLSVCTVPESCLGMLCLLIRDRRVLHRTSNIVALGRSKKIHTATRDMTAPHGGGRKHFLRHSGDGVREYTHRACHVSTATMTTRTEHRNGEREPTLLPDMRKQAS